MLLRTPRHLTLTFNHNFYLRQRKCVTSDRAKGAASCCLSSSTSLSLSLLLLSIIREHFSHFRTPACGSFCSGPVRADDDSSRGVYIYACLLGTLVITVITRQSPNCLGYSRVSAVSGLLGGLLRHVTHATGSH